MKAKSLSKFFSHVHSVKIASSINLLPSKVWLEKMILFRCCHTVHVRASHQLLHRLRWILLGKQNACWEKCCHGFCEKAPWMLTHVIDSHHHGSILSHVKNTEYCPVGPIFQIQSPFLWIWIQLPTTSLRKQSAISSSLSNKCLLHLNFHSHPFSTHILQMLQNLCLK